MNDLIREIIKDFEMMSETIQKRLTQLYSMLGEEKPNNDVKSMIEVQRQEMMQKIEQMRKQAMDQVQDSMSGLNMPMNKMGFNPMIPPMPRKKDE